MYMANPDRATLVANKATRTRDNAKEPVLEMLGVIGALGVLGVLEAARWEIRESSGLGTCRVAALGVAAEKRARLAMARGGTIVAGMLGLEALNGWRGSGLAE